MPFFHYTASDKQGQPVEGTIQAANTQEASRVLAQRGFQVRAIADPRGGITMPTQSPSAQAVRAQLRSLKGSDRQRYFLFAQIAAQLRAGIAPAQAFPTLASQISNRGYRESLQRIATLSADGRPMSEVMAMYPGLYPGHVVGLVHAGEVGGFLPDACAAVSEHAGAAHKFRIWHWFLWFAVVSALLVLPAIAVSMMAFSGTFIKMWKGNAEVDSAWVIHQFIVTFFEVLRGPTGIVLFAFYLAIVGGLWLLNKPRATRFRHSIGLRIPGYGKRSVNEGVTLFSWALGLLSRGGVTPQTAWALSGECVPNVVVRERLVQAGSMMRANSRVSEAAFKSGLFPEEYAPTISTGEMIGDLPGALERLAQVSRGEYESQTQYAKYRAGCWGLLILGVSSIGGAAVLYYIYGRLLSWVAEHGAD